VNYVDNKQFYDEIFAYRAKLAEAKEKGLDTPRISEYIGECIFKIAEKLSTKPCFANYSFRDEMVADGYENCILYFKDYNPEITQNPFAYFTQIIFYAFLRRISKEEKNRYTIYKNFQETMALNPSNHLVDENDKSIIPKNMYDNINDFMNKFENNFLMSFSILKYVCTKNICLHAYDVYSILFLLKVANKMTAQLVFKMLVYCYTVKPLQELIIMECVNKKQ
jgi:hypothetical protein